MPARVLVNEEVNVEMTIPSKVIHQSYNDMVDGIERIHSFILADLKDEVGQSVLEFFEVYLVHSFCCVPLSTLSPFLPYLQLMPLTVACVDCVNREYWRPDQSWGIEDEWVKLVAYRSRKGIA